jgi:hypothetical protein
LSAERRQEILAEALGGRALEIFASHQDATVGELIQALKSDASWSTLRALNVSAVLRPTGGGATAPQHAPESAGPVVGRARGGRRSKLTDGTLEQLLKLIGDKPGLRSEQIYELSSLPPKVAKAGLAKLRATKRVKTTGIKRAMTYMAA